MSEKRLYASSSMFHQLLGTFRAIFPCEFYPPFSTPSFSYHAHSARGPEERGHNQYLSFSVKGSVRINLSFPSVLTEMSASQESNNEAAGAATSQTDQQAEDPLPVGFSRPIASNWCHSMSQLVKVDFEWTIHHVLRYELNRQGVVISEPFSAQEIPNCKWMSSFRLQSTIGCSRQALFGHSRRCQFIPNSNPNSSQICNRQQNARESLAEGTQFAERH
jgi:hypothetical protein